MKTKFIIILAIFSIFSCKVKEMATEDKEAETFKIKNLPQQFFDPNYTLFQVSNDNFYGKDSAITTHYLDGNIELKGKFAIDRTNNVSSLKIGEFEIYYENGQLKEKGKYNIGRYMQCCPGGLCSQFYNYKLGEWQYYFPSGVKKANVIYGLKQFNIKTSCEGGDQITFGEISLSESQFFNELGQNISPTNEILNELETVLFNRDEFGVESMSIINGKISLVLMNDIK